MNKRRAVLGVVVLAAAGAVIFVLVQKKPAPQASTANESSANPHDWKGSPLTRMYEAPEGKTPCETAYNAVIAGQQAAKERRRPPLFSKIADRDDFLAKCSALPPAAQICMTPRYETTHRDECRKSRPPQETLDAMFKVSATDDPDPH